MGRAFEVRKAAMQKTSAAKSKLYSKFAKEIYMVAKKGEPDLEVNLNLKRVVERAKQSQVPADVINRAIKKAEDKDAADLNKMVYEAFGPGGSTFIIECMSDNVNRTIANIKTCFNKANTKLGVSGSVSFNYEHFGMIVVDYKSEEEVAEYLFEKEIDFKDIEKDEEYVVVYCEPTQLYEVKTILEEKFEIDSSEIMWEANEKVKLNESDKKQVERLLNLLEEVEDVDEVYHNVIL